MSQTESTTPNPPGIDWTLTYNGDRSFTSAPLPPRLSMNTTIAVNFTNQSNAPVILGISTNGKIGNVDGNVAIFDYSLNPARDWIPHCLASTGPAPLAVGETRTVQIEVLPVAKPSGQAEFKYLFFVVDESGAGSTPQHSGVIKIDPHVIIN